MWGRRKPDSKEKMVPEKKQSLDKLLVGVIDKPSDITPATKKLVYEHPKGYMAGNLKGMNTKPFNYSVITKGNTTDQNLFTVDTGVVLEGHQGILSMTAFKMTLFNIPQVDADTLPEIFYLVCDELSGMTDTSGNATHVVATATPCAITAATDNLGLSTFSIIFGMESDTINWDIGSIANLTFRLKIGMNKDDALYPLET